MLGMRTFWRSGAVVLGSALLCAASLASATASVVHDPAGRGQAPAAAAKQLVDAEFGSVSCVPSQSTYPYECEATGWYAERVLRLRARRVVERHWLVSG